MVWEELFVKEFSVLHMQLCFFFFWKTVVGALCSEKPKADRRVMALCSPSSPGAGGEEGMQHAGFYRPKLATAAAANPSLLCGEVISALLRADVLQTAVVSETVFPHVRTWTKKYFSLGFLDSPLHLSCCTEILGVLQAFCRVSLRWLKGRFHVCGGKLKSYRLV